MKYLTESQIKNYNDDGFLLLKKFFSEEEMMKEVEEFKQEVKDLINKSKKVKNK